MKFKYEAAVGATPPLPKEKSFAEYFEELETTGKTVVPCPHGHGNYMLRVSGTHWYHTPEIVFVANEKCPMPFRNPLFAGRAFRTTHGRVIPWYPKWNGYAYRNTSLDNTHLAKMIVRIILAGRKLYLIRCGTNMSSLNNDDTIEAEHMERYKIYGDAVFG